MLVFQLSHGTLYTTQVYSWTMKLSFCNPFNPIANLINKLALSDWTTRLNGQLTYSCSCYDGGYMYQEYKYKITTNT